MAFQIVNRDMAMRADKPEMTSSAALALRLLRAYVRPQAGRIFMPIILMLVSAAMTGAMAKLLEPVIDQVFTEKNGEMLLPVALLVFAVFAARGLSAYGHNVI